VSTEQKVASLEQARAQVELEDVLSIFDEETRESARAALTGYGDAFTGRGTAINSTLGELPEFLTHLTPVMRRLSAPRTQLDELFKQIGRAAAQAAPVAVQQAQLFTYMADTFEALARDPEALRQTIERSPPTLQTAIESFRVQQPFLTDFVRLSRELEPATAALPRSLPRINRALVRGQPTLRNVPRLSRSAIDTFRALDELAENPNTNLALRDLDRTIDIGAPLLQFVAPYQTVCSYWNYWWTHLSEHLSEPVRNGTIERVGLVTTNETQDDRLGSSEADKPADVPRGQDPTSARAADGNPLTKLNTQFYGPAVDARGNADCQAGQTGYPDGPLNTGGRFGEHVVVDQNTPGLRGGTFKSRELGIDNLEDVP
jgi:hypothetical protein